MFSESSLSHWQKNFVLKTEIDAQKTADLCIKYEDTDH